jgi:group I intron endonuclease
MIFYVYTLSDPRTNCIRYVGQTAYLKKRYGEHCRQQYRKDHRACWLNLLYFSKLLPTMTIIEECNETTWAEREIYWIAYYREQGCDLVNGTDGGDGVYGLKHSETTKSIWSKQRKGRVRPDSEKQKISNTMKGVKKSEATRVNMKQAQITNALSRAKLTPEQVQDIRNLLLDNKTQQSIADRYGVSRSTIQDIKEHKTWRWL